MPNAISFSGAARAARFLVGCITKQNTKYTGQLALFRYKSRWHWANAVRLIQSGAIQSELRNTNGIRSNTSLSKQE